MKTFICFSARDRYKVVESLVYHLKNFGLTVWYDRTELLMGDNRIEKNLIEGAQKCKYAIIVLSKNTIKSNCAMEEISILKTRWKKDKLTIFPILYEINPLEIPFELQWIKEIIFKEVTADSGTREVCNNIMCKITLDILSNYKYKSLKVFLKKDMPKLSKFITTLLKKYSEIDYSNFNSRLAILYAIFTYIFYQNSLEKNYIVDLISKIFETLFDETKLNLEIDYRDLWLSENCVCILLNLFYFR